VTETNNRTGGRAILLLIAGLPVTMILASTWLWYFVERGDIDIIGALGTANSGQLLPEPLNIRALEFEAADGSQASLATSEPKWTMLLVNDGPTCDADCNELLYLTRQIRIAIGRDYQRTQRLLVVDTPVEAIQSSGEADARESGSKSENSLAGALLPQLQSDHVDLKVWRRNDQVVVPEGQLMPDSWYLVDPSGWVMMRYSTEVNYKDVIGDLKFLLKNSGG
jgi:hypothetical protein